jgi:hypothetical protein
VEIHIPLDELLGLRGPLLHMCRNVVWLVSFNCAYLGIFIALPSAIGSQILELSAFSSSLWGLLTWAGEHAEKAALAAAEAVSVLPMGASVVVPVLRVLQRLLDWVWRVPVGVVRHLLDMGQQMLAQSAETGAALQMRDLLTIAAGYSTVVVVVFAVFSAVKFAEKVATAFRYELVS